MFWTTPLHRNSFIISSVLLIDRHIYVLMFLNVLFKRAFKKSPTCLIIDWSNWFDGTREA